MADQAGGEESARRLENKSPEKEYDYQRVEDVADQAGGQESARWLENKLPEEEKVLLSKLGYRSPCLLAVVQVSSPGE